MIRRYVCFATVLAICVGFLGFAAAPVVGATRPSHGAASVMPPQVYVPLGLNQANSQTLTPALYIRSARAYDFIDPATGSRTIDIVGEYQNDSTIPFDHLSVGVQFFDAEGNFVEGGAILPFLFRTFPGQATPFASRFTQVPPEVESFAVYLVGDSEREPHWYVPLPVLGAELYDDAGAAVRGQVQNNTPDVINETIVALTLYDAAGEVVDVGATSSSMALQPGATQAFTIPTYNSDPATTNYRVQAQGLPALPPEAASAGNQVAPRPSRPADAPLLPRHAER